MNTPEISDYLKKIYEETKQPITTIISAKNPDGNYKNVESDRYNNLKVGIDAVGNDAYRYAPRGDVTLYGSQVTASKVPQIEKQFWNDDPNTALDVTKAGSASATKEASFARFNSGTNTTTSIDAQTFETIDYLTSSEIMASFAVAFTQPPTSSGDYSTIGLSDGNDGFEIGYKGTTFGIRRLRAGSEKEFTPRTDFNIDKLDGNPQSEYQRNDEPVAINLQTQDMWRIRYGWYGIAPTHIEVLAPDGHWVAVHKYDFTDEDKPQTKQPDLPVRDFIEKNSSDSTDIQQNVNAMFGGIMANISLTQQPDGDYVPDKASGNVFTTTDLLTANEEFISDWYNTDGWEGIGINIDADQPSASDGIIVEYSSNIQAQSPTVDNDNMFTYSQDDVDNDESLRVVLDTQLNGFRIRYTNGSIGQNDFKLTTSLFSGTRERKTNLNTPISNDTVISTRRAINYARSDSGDIEQVTKPDGDKEGERATISRHETDTPLRPDDTFTTTQTDVPDTDGGGPINLLNHSLTGRSAFRISNNGSEAIFIGPDDTVSTTNGYRIDSSEDKEFPLSEDADIWAISTDGTGDSTTHRLDATASGTSGTASNPDNAISSDDSRATFDAKDELIDASGYDASAAQARDEVSEVLMGIEAQSTTQGLQDISYEETASNIQLGGTSITTNTSLQSDNDSIYTALVSIRDESISVDSVTGLGLSWSQQTEGISANGVRTVIWLGEGNPSSSEAVTANLSTACDSVAIGASRLTGVKESNPVKNTASNTGATDGWSVSPTPNGSGDFIIGGAAIIDVTSNTPGSPDTEQLELSQDTERMTIALQTRDVTSSDEATDGTWGTTAGWAGAAIALNQKPLNDPKALIEYEVGSEGTGATTLTTTVDTTSDSDYKQDITSDRPWTYTDIDNTTVTVTKENDDAEDLKVDHIYIEFTEVDTGATQRVSIMETGRSGGV